MKATLHAVAVVSLLALSACSTVDTKPAADTAAASQPEKVAEDGHSITGTRLPGKRTERLVRAVGAQDYKDSRDAQPNPLNSQ